MTIYVGLLQSQEMRYTKFEITKFDISIFQWKNIQTFVLNLILFDTKFPTLSLQKGLEPCQITAHVELCNFRTSKSIELVLTETT